MSGPAGPLSVHLAASEAPEREALVIGTEVLELSRLAARVAGAQWALRSRGWAPGSRVAVVARPDLPSVVGVSALLEEGLVPVMLHPRWPAELQDELTHRVGAAARLELAEVGAGADALAPEPRSERSPDEDFAIFFTSGSSGVPKGVRLSRRAFEASARASATHLGWQPDDRWLLNLPLAHIGGFSILTRTRLARRAALIPVAEAGRGFEAGSFMQTLVDGRVTLASLVPTMLGRVLAAELRPPPALRALLLGGAAAPAAVLEGARRLGWPVLTTYGLTEACSQVTVQPLGWEPTAHAGAGLPLPGVELRIEQGLIELRGPTLLSGYLPPSPAVGPEGWFSTGDLGRIEPGTGRLFVQGRASEMIISGGENVAPGRVEEVLRACPGVLDAVVYGLPDDEWGEVVSASLVPDGDPGRLEDLEPTLRARLAGFERPRRLVWIEALPLSENGKVDRGRARRDAERARKAEVLGRID